MTLLEFILQAPTLPRPLTVPRPPGPAWSYVIYPVSWHEFTYFIISFMNMCSFISSLAYRWFPSYIYFLRNYNKHLHIHNIYIIYILGQLLVSSVAPHLSLPIIVILNQQLVFLLMNWSHLNTESPRVGWVAKMLLPWGQKCIS